MDRIGSRSEGPEYFLKLSTPNEFGQLDLPIVKKVKSWEEDPNLHQFINKMVVISGESVKIKHTSLDGTKKAERIEYNEIKEIINL